MPVDAIDKATSLEALVADLRDRVSSLETREGLTADSITIDGDQLDIDWNPSYSTPSTTPSEADDVDDLTAHLYGIDQKLGQIGTADFLENIVEDTSPTLGGDLDADSKDLHNVNLIEFANQELSNLADGGTGSPNDYSEGVAFYDRNVSTSVYPLGESGKGGLQLYTSGDGWGLLFDTQNMVDLQAEFYSLKVSGGGANETIDTIRDEDDMASDDPNALSTQQAIKAYVDNNAGGADILEIQVFS